MLKWILQFVKNLGKTLGIKGLKGLYLIILGWGPGLSLSAVLALIVGLVLGLVLGWWWVGALAIGLTVFAAGFLMTWLVLVGFLGWCWDLIASAIPSRAKPEPTQDDPPPTQVIAELEAPEAPPAD